MATTSRSTLRQSKEEMYPPKVRYIDIKEQKIYLFWNFIYHTYISQ
jgi:hypothetical protein